MDAPKAFVSHATVDNEIAEQLAEDLRAKGIDVWTDFWELKLGDSLRRKIIDEGIGNAKFFIVIITKKSINRPWVQEEMDAAFVRKLQGMCTFIPTLLGVKVTDLPLSLQTVKVSRLDDYEKALGEFVDVCFGQSKKPPLGIGPAITQLTCVNLSSNAALIATRISERDEYGAEKFFSYTLEDLLSDGEMEQSLVEEALDELIEAGMIEIQHTLGPLFYVFPRNRLFWLTDLDVKGWNPEQDSKKLASALVNTDKDSVSLLEVASLLDWEHRRLNPAATFLIDHGYAGQSHTTGSAPYASAWLGVTPKTRRFARE